MKNCNNAENLTPTELNGTNWMIRGLIRLTGFIEEAARSKMQFDPQDAALFLDLMERAKLAIQGAPRAVHPVTNRRPAVTGRRVPERQNSSRSEQTAYNTAEIEDILKLPEAEFKVAMAKAIARLRTHH